MTPQWAHDDIPESGRDWRRPRGIFVVAPIGGAAGERIALLQARYDRSFDVLRHARTRGALDVPKERFILYPEAGLSSDESMVLGWAGWDHAEQFLALAAHMDRMIADGAEDEQLIPILAGLHELVPWVKQWHSEIDPTFGVSLGDFSAQELEQRRARLGVSYDDLEAWRPPKRTRRRKARA